MVGSVCSVWMFFGELRSFKLATFLRKGLSGFCGKGNRELSSASKKGTLLAGGKQFLKGIPGLLLFFVF